VKRLRASPIGYGRIRRLLVEDRRRVAGAARLPGSTQRVEIVIVPSALARVVINEGSTPRIFRDVFSLQIRPVPVRDPGGACDQRSQTLFGRRIDSDIELVDIEHTGYALDRLVRNFFFGGFQLPECGGRDKSDKQPEDGEHNEELEQGKTALLLLALVLGEVERNAPALSRPQVSPHRAGPSNQTGSGNHRVVQLVE